MAMVLTDGKIKVGAYRLPDRKRIAICVLEGSRMNVCGYFTSEANAEFFMRKVAEMIGAEGDGDK